MFFIACDAGVLGNKYCFSVVSLNSETGEVATYTSPVKEDATIIPADAEMIAFKVAMQIAKQHTGGVKLFTDQLRIINSLEGVVGARKKTLKKQINEDLQRRLGKVEDVEVYKITSHKGYEVQDLLHRIADAECANNLKTSKPSTIDAQLAKLEKLFERPHPMEWLLHSLLGLRGY